jgi:hypothetical protein
MTEAYSVWAIAPDETIAQQIISQLESSPIVLVADTADLLSTGDCFTGEESDSNPCFQPLACNACETGTHDDGTVYIFADWIIRKLQTAQPNYDMLNDIAVRHNITFECVHSDLGYRDVSFIGPNAVTETLCQYVANLCKSISDLKRQIDHLQRMGSHTQSIDPSYAKLLNAVCEMASAYRIDDVDSETSNS